MANDSDSDSFLPERTPHAKPTGWLKVGALAAASALAGGLAAAWYYRSALTRLRQAEAQPVAPHADEDHGDKDYDI